MFVVALKVGKPDGASVGTLDGLFVGLEVVGEGVGFSVASTVGWGDGSPVGLPVVG